MKNGTSQGTRRSPHKPPRIHKPVLHALAIFLGHTRLISLPGTQRGFRSKARNSALRSMFGRCANCNEFSVFCATIPDL